MRVCKWIDCKAALPRPRRLFTVYFQRFRNKHESEMGKKKQHAYLTLSLFLSLARLLLLLLVKQKYCILILIRNTRAFEGASHPKIAGKWNERESKPQHPATAAGGGAGGRGSARRRLCEGLVCMAKVSSDDVACACIFEFLAGGTTTSAPRRGSRLRHRQPPLQLHSYFNILLLVCCCCLWLFIASALLERADGDDGHSVHWKHWKLIST